MTLAGLGVGAVALYFVLGGGQEGGAASAMGDGGFGGSGITKKEEATVPQDITEAEADILKTYLEGQSRVSAFAPNLSVRFPAQSTSAPRYEYAMTPTAPAPAPTPISPTKKEKTTSTSVSGADIAAKLATSSPLATSTTKKDAAPVTDSSFASQLVSFVTNPVMTILSWFN